MFDGFGQFGEGDVLSLGKARADAFANRKIYINSTPTVKGMSNIEAEFADSDQREYFMPCPECSEYMSFRWEYFNYEVDAIGRRKSNVDVTCTCPNCGGVIEEYQKTDMMAQGKWIAQNKGHEHAGFKLNSLYSPLGWLSWNEIATEFIRAHTALKVDGETRLMQVWKNTRMAEVFADSLDGVTIKSAHERVEDYQCQVPDEVKIITAGVDTQDDRFEIEVLGHGSHGETWSIDYKVIAGDPQFDETRDELDDYLAKIFTRKDGRKMRISGTCVDTGGHRTQIMYQYCLDRTANNVFAIKGGNTPTAPIVNKTVEDLSEDNLTLYMLNVTALKDDFYAKLKVKKHGNNYCHFPNRDVYSDKYFKMLTAEKRDEKGKYIKVRLRNEALDCRIYASGVLHILDIVVDNKSEPVVVYSNIPQQSAKPVDVVNNEIVDYLDEF